MKHIVHYCLLFILLFWLSGCKSTENQAFFGFHFTQRTKSVTLPFRSANNLIIIQMQINESDTMNFILDTGVKTALLTELNFGQELPLKFAGSRKIWGHGKGEKDLIAHHAYGNTFRIGNKIVGEHQNLLVLSEDVFFLSAKLGLKINGLIGADVFRNFVVEIDYPNHKLILHDPKRYKPRRNFKCIPIIIEQGKPYICADITDTEGNTAYAKLLVDTGASHSLLLEEDATQNIFLPSQVFDAYLGSGLNGSIWGKVGRISMIKLSDYQLDNVDAAYPDSLSMEGIRGIANRNGNLGANLLKRFRVAFDYRQNKMYLRPSRFYKDPFYHNLSGMEVSAPIPGLQYYVISEIMPDMPAVEAGLQKGDEILSINGKPAKEYNLNDITRLLQSKPGRRIKMKIRREGQIIKTDFVLSLSI